MPVFGIGCTDLHLDEPPNRAFPSLDLPLPTLLVTAIAIGGLSRVVFDQCTAVVVLPPVSPIMSPLAQFLASGPPTLLRNPSRARSRSIMANNGPAIDLRRSSLSLVAVHPRRSAAAVDNNNDDDDPPSSPSSSIVAASSM